MTIYQKGWFDELKPALDSIGTSVQHMINPNLDAQEALKTLIIKDPIGMRQKLRDMGPDAVSKTFGKQALKYIEGLNESAESIVNKKTLPIITGMMEDPENVQEFARNKLQLSSKEERRTKTAQMTSAEAAARQSGAIADVNIAESAVKIDALHDAKIAKTVIDGARSRLGNMSIADAYKNGKLTPKESAAIFADEATTKEVKTSLDTQFEKQKLDLATYNSRSERMNAESSRMNAMRERTSGTPEGIIMRAQVETAQFIAQRTGKPQLMTAIIELSKDEAKQKALEDMPTRPAGEGPVGVLWDAAHAVKDYRSELSVDTKRKRVSAFMTTNAKDFTIANSKKALPEEKASAVARINALGMVMFGEYGRDRPVVEYKEPDSGFWNFGRDAGKKVVGGVTIHGNSELTGMISEANPELNIGVSQEQKASLETGIAQWKAASIEEVRASLAGMSESDRNVQKGILSQAGIKF